MRVESVAHGLEPNLRAQLRQWVEGHADDLACDAAFFGESRYEEALERELDRVFALDLTEFLAELREDSRAEVESLLS